MTTTVTTTAAGAHVPASSVLFAAAARRLAQHARSVGWSSCSFRSPPRQPGVARALRRDAAGRVMVAVRLRDRRWGEVAVDMVDGLFAANRGVSASVPADELRSELVASLISLAD